MVPLLTHMTHSDPAFKDKIVLVDEAGRPIGAADKLSSHHADTPLHLAFSCYIFDAHGRLLLTQRAATKKVWPTVWTNSCCGHPAPDEPMEDAIARRVSYELGMRIDSLSVILPDYRYRTTPYNGIIENEVCPVYLAKASADPQPNGLEVMDWRWVAWPAFLDEVSSDNADRLSWWCKDQALNMRDQPELLDYLA